MLPVTDDSKQESSMAPSGSLRNVINAEVFLVHTPHANTANAGKLRLEIYVFIQRNVVKTVGTGRLEPQRGELMQPRVQTLG